MCRCSGWTLPIGGSTTHIRNTDSHEGREASRPPSWRTGLHTHPGSTHTTLIGECTGAPDLTTLWITSEIICLFSWRPDSYLLSLNLTPWPHLRGGVGSPTVCSANGMCQVGWEWMRCECVCSLTSGTFPRGRARPNQGGSSTQQQHHLILNETQTFWPSV